MYQDNREFVQQSNIMNSMVDYAEMVLKNRRLLQKVLKHPSATQQILTCCQIQHADQLIAIVLTLAVPVQCLLHYGDSSPQ